MFGGGGPEQLGATKQPPSNKGVDVATKPLESKLHQLVLDTGTEPAMAL